MVRGAPFLEDLIRKLSGSKGYDRKKTQSLSSCHQCHSACKSYRSPYGVDRQEG